MSKQKKFDDSWSEPEASKIEKKTAWEKETITPPEVADFSLDPKETPGLDEADFPPQQGEPPLPPGGILPESKELTALKTQVERTMVLETEANSALVNTAEHICKNKANPTKVNDLVTRIGAIKSALENQTGALATAEDALKKAGENLSKSFSV